MDSRDRPGALQQRDENAQEQEPDLEQYIEVLIEHQKKWEEEGKYVEAEMAHNRVKELKQQLKLQQDNEIHMRHQQDLEELEQAHIEEFNNFNADWDKRMNEFQVHSAQLVQTLEGKHEQELQEEHEKLIASFGMQEQMDSSQPMVPVGFKRSPELLNLISTQKSLAKQKEYKDAHKIQIKAQELERKEIQKHVQEAEAKMRKFEQKLIKKQELEMESLRKRIIAGENEQKKQRALDLERMFQRYQNVKKELENNHKKELNSFKKGPRFNANQSVVSKGNESSIRGVKISAQKKRPTNINSNGFSAV